MRRLKYPFFSLLLVMGILFNSFPQGVISEGEVPVTVNAPAQVLSGGSFTARIDIGNVTGFDSCNYDVSYNPATLRLTDVTAGLIGAVPIPVDIFNEISAGVFTVVQNVPGTDGVSGSGYLAILHFQVPGNAGQTSNIDLANGTLSSSLAQEIPATWTGATVQIFEHPATALVVSDINTPLIAGVPSNIKIEAKDTYGSTATGYRGTVHFSSTDTQVILPSDYTFTVGDAGIHTFMGGVTLKTSGIQSVTATDIVNASITGTSGNIVVIPAVASNLVVSGFPPVTDAGVAHPVTVTAKDAFGNTATSYSGKVHFTSGDSHAVLPPDYQFLDIDHGTHIFSSVILKTESTNQSISVTDTQTSSITGTQSGIRVNITHPTLATLDASAVNDHSATLKGKLTSPGTADRVHVQFEYWPEGDTNHNTVDGSPASLSTAGGTFVYNLTGLSPSKKYHFMAKGKVDGDTNYSPVPGRELTFTTSTILKSIAVTPPIASIDVGTIKAYSATGNYSDGTLPDITSKVTWDSTDQSVATINTSGVALGIKAGSVNITATLGNIHSDTSATILNVTDPALSSLIVDPSTLVIPMGQTQNVRVIADYSNGTKVSVTDKVTWNFSTPDIVTINNSGKVTPLQNGTTNAIASYSVNGVTKTSTTTITITKAPLVNLTISPPTPTANVGESVQLTAIGAYGDSSTADLTGKVSWNSTSLSIATINSSGLARTYAAGEANINATITWNSSYIMSNTIVLHVDPKVLTRLEVSPPNPLIAYIAGNPPTIQFTATAVYSDLSTANVTSSAIWTHSLPVTAATVSDTAPDKGLATLVSSGTTAVTAIYTEGIHTKSGSAILNVLPDTIAPTVVLSYPIAGSTFNTTTPVVSGYVDDGNATVSVIVNNDNAHPIMGFPLTGPDQDGYYSFNTTATLHTGNNSLRARAVDGAGNSGFSETRDVVVNPATMPITINLPKDRTLTKLNIIPVTGTAPGYDQLTLWVNGTALTPAMAVTVGNFSITLSLSEGDNKIIAAGYPHGSAGDPGALTTSGTITVTRDTKAPSIALDSPANGAIFNTSAITVSGSVDDPNLYQSSVTLYHYQGEFGSVAPEEHHITVVSGHFSYSLSLVQGINAIAIEAKDILLNNSITVPISVTLDTTKPKVTLLSPAKTLTWKNSSSLLVQGTIDDLSINSASLHFKAGTGAATNIVLAVVRVNPGDVFGTFSQIINLQGGDNTLEVKASDTAGNEGTSGIYHVNLDTIPPDITVGLSEPTDSIIISISSNEALDASSSPTAGINTIPPTVVALTRVGVNQWVGTYSDPSLHTVVDGNYTLTVTGKDLAGNTSTRTATFTKTSISVDATHPAVVENATTKLDIEATYNLTGTISGDVSVTQHIQNPSGLVDHPSGSSNGAAFVDINAPPELRDALNAGNINITITIHYNPDELPPGTDESTLKLYAWSVTDGRWEEVTDNIVVDTISKTISGILHHLSTYGVFSSLNYTLTIVKIGNGTVSPDMGQHIYTEGTVVALVATPDSGWKFSGWSGDVDSSGNTVTMNSNETVTATFESSGSGGGGGGGGGSSYNKISLNGLSSPSALQINSQGIIQGSAQLKTLDGKVILDIASGTKLLTSSNTPLSNLTANVLTSPPAPPAGNALIMAYTLGPDGAKFDPAMTLTMIYTPEALPSDVSEKDLYLAYYDSISWQPLVSMLNTKNQSANTQITHFSNYALLGKITPPQTPSPSPSATPSPSIPPSPSPSRSPIPTLSPAPSQSPAPTLAITPTPLVQAPPIQTTVPATSPTTEQLPVTPFNWVPVIIILVAVVIVLTVSLIVLRRRKSRGKS